MYNNDTIAGNGTFGVVYKVIYKLIFLNKFLN